MLRRCYDHPRSPATSVAGHFCNPVLEQLMIARKKTRKLSPPPLADERRGIDLAFATVMQRIDRRQLQAPRFTCLLPPATIRSHPVSHNVSRHQASARHDWDRRPRPNPHSPASPSRGLVQSGFNEVAHLTAEPLVSRDLTEPSRFCWQPLAG